MGESSRGQGRNVDLSLTALIKTSASVRLTRTTRLTSGLDAVLFDLRGQPILENLEHIRTALLGLLL